jgi:hypothetical protein
VPASFSVIAAEEARAHGAPTAGTALLQRPQAREQAQFSQPIGAGQGFLMSQFLYSLPNHQGFLIPKAPSLAG